MSLGLLLNVLFLSIDIFCAKSFKVCTCVCQITHNSNFKRILAQEVVTYFVQFLENENIQFPKCFTGFYIEGFQPEWCISTMIYCQDTPFWSETLNMQHYSTMLKSATITPKLSSFFCTTAVQHTHTHTHTYTNFLSCWYSETLHNV